MADQKQKPDGRRLKNLLKEAIEAAGPDLRRLMATPRRGKVIAVKPAGGTYLCTVQAVLNDGRPDPGAPVIPDVEIPLLWAGPNRGLVCPPKVGEYCDIGFYDGDSNSPYISNFRPNGQAPPAELDEFMVQYDNGIRFGFKADGTFIIEAPKIEATATEHIKAAAPLIEAKAGQKITAEAPVVEITADRVTVTAPLIQLEGRVEVTGGIYTRPGSGGHGMEMDGQVKIINGGLEAQGDIHSDADLDAGGDVKAGGQIIDSGGNTNHHSH